MQNELIEYLFDQEFRGMFEHIFEGCERTFVNRLIVNLIYKSYRHEEIIQSSKSVCDEVFFIKTGAVAVCEPTCYQEPIVVYGPGSFINLY